MRLNFTTHPQMVLGPVFLGDQVLALEGIPMFLGHGDQDLAPSGIYGMS